MVFSPYLTSELVINSNAEVKKNLKLFFEKTKIIPAKVEGKRTMTIYYLSHIDI